MKYVFYFMTAFVALIFLFGGVLSDDINLNQELHGMVVKSLDYEEPLVVEESIDPIQEAELYSDLIVVYPYEG